MFGVVKEYLIKYMEDSSKPCNNTETKDINKSKSKNNKKK